MASALLAPGVKTKEHLSGLAVVRGAVSNRLLAIGMARRGPVGRPVRILSFQQYTDRFGDDMAYGELGIQMRQFFTAGGGEAIVVRAANSESSADLMINDGNAPTDVIEITAVDAGLLGNDIRIEIDHTTNDPGNTFHLTVYRATTDFQGRDTRVEETVYNELSMDPTSVRYIMHVINDKSDLIMVEDQLNAPPVLPAASTIYELGGLGATQGADGNVPVLADYAAIYQTVSREVDLFNILILPRGDGQTDANRLLLWGAASAFCRSENALLIADPESDNGAWNDVSAVEIGLAALKNGVEQDVTAGFWPRVKVPLGLRQVFIDPSGTVAGVIAASIARSGPWRAAAGLSASLTGTTGLEYYISDAENGVINPRGLNALVSRPTGVVVWGARTFAGDDNFAVRDFAYVPVRITTDFIKNSISRALETFMFYPNNRETWASITTMCTAFMHGLYEKGALPGAKASDAYEVQCNELTTNPTNILLGELNVWIKFAPLFPAEFIFLNVQQKILMPAG